MPTTTILLDLDDTLVIEQPGARDAFLAACERATAKRGCAAAALHEAVLKNARNLWYTSPSRAYIESIGISSWEGLWAEFTGDDPNLVALRAWGPTYRREAWTRGLADLGLVDAALADELADAYRKERRARHQVFPETREVLDALRGRYRLGMVTNGIPDVQFDKIRAAGIEGYFDAIVVSSDVGVGKPNPLIFETALKRLGGAAGEAVMVGNSLSRDIVGAKAAGIRAVWVNREHKPRDPAVAVVPDAEIADLRELFALL